MFPWPPRECLPTFLSGLHYLIPVGVLLYYLIAREMTPLTSAFMAIVAAMGMFVVSSLIQGIRGRPIVPGHCQATPSPFAPLAPW